MRASRASYYVSAECLWTVDHLAGQWQLKDIFNFQNFPVIMMAFVVARVVLELLSCCAAAQFNWINRGISSSSSVRPVWLIIFWKNGFIIEWTIWMQLKTSAWNHRIGICGNMHCEFGQPPFLFWKHGFKSIFVNYDESHKNVYTTWMSRSALTLPHLVPHVIPRILQTLHS